MKIMRVIIVIISIVLITFMILSIVSYGGTEDVINQIISESYDSVAEEPVKSVIGAVIYVAQTVGTGMAIIMLIVLATKYMLASAGEKADIKKHATTYLIGAMVMIGASGILGIIQKFVLKSFGED